MSEIVEKNDVDITKLFSWGRVYEILDPDTEEVVSLVYMRILGDADLNRARVYAIRKSAELRRKLKDPNSDERVAFIRTIDELAEDDLINLILLFSSRELTNEASRNVKLKAPKTPKSTASLEEGEKFQKEVDEYPKKRQELIRAEIDKQIDKLKKSLKEKGKEELYKEYVKNLIDEFCEKEAFESFKNMQVYLGCYKTSDYKELYFSSFDEFDNLESTMKEKFKTAYDTIDISMSELKKLRLATQ